MKKIEEYILGIYNKLPEGDSQLISEDSVKDAIRYIDAFDLSDSRNLFVVVAALNLLNADVKRGNLKSSLYYGYIKSNVGKVADYVVSHKKDFEDTSVYYDKNQRCFYFNILGIIFSFHQITENARVLEATNNNPIIWPGIRLQRIAQSVFEYAVNVITGEKEILGDLETNIPKEKGIKTLIPCPECGRLVSKSAKFCPNCGYEFCRDDEIANNIFKGDYVQIEVGNETKSGIVFEKGTSFIALQLNDKSIYKIRYNALSSILLLTPPCQDAPLSTTQIVRLLYEILAKEGINITDNIVTNSTIQECSTANISAVTDGGKSVHCKAPLGYSKGKTKSGDRMFFFFSYKKDESSSIIEIPYSVLFDKFLNSIRKVNKNANSRHRINNVIAYLNVIVRNNEAKADLQRIKEIIERLAPADESSISIEKNKLDNENDASVILTNQTGKEQKGLEMPAKNLEIVEDAKSNQILINDLPIMSDIECRQVEKELDALIREGKREDCLSKSYSVITTQKPTPKYLRSYLDRIVNTEIALGHIEQARDALAVLIAFSAKQQETKPNNLCHLYISLARLLVRLGDGENAILALEWAEYIYPKNKKIITNLRKTLVAKEIKGSIDSVGDTEQEALFSRQDIVVSRMLIQDVEQYAKTQISLDGEEESSPIELFNTAVVASSDDTKSFEFRAQMFLDAAAAYLNAGMTSKTEFKLAVAHYARMKGNSLMAKITESVQQYPDSQSHLIAECDSARSYYLEALELYNDLAQKRYLQELLLKYLKIESLASQVEGGKTPDTEWHKGTLKTKMQDCLNDENAESQKALYRTCIAIGASSERAWASLAQDEDGIGPLYGKLGSDIKFRGKAYNIINTMEKTTVDVSFTPGEFLRKIFDNRQTRIKKMKVWIDNCLSWNFTPFDLASFEVIWSSIEEYRDLITATDRQTIVSINEIITILKPYAGRKENERYRNLVSSQQILMKSQRTVAETTTYYGRVFFSHLQEKWLQKISHQIEERDASSLPRLTIFPEPCYIRINDEGNGVIDFVVTNTGDSTAQSFVVNAIINGKEYTILHSDELSAGDSCGECFVSSDFCNLESADVIFNLTAKYQAKDLPTIVTEATYEFECGDVLTDEIQIPWKISDTPKENIFKGREGKLTTLINHYLSKDRTFTYILYGLTRTGKSSILDYLCERIEGKSLHEDFSKIIHTFRWNLLEVSSKNSSSKTDTIAALWTRLLEINIYNKLDDDIKDIVDSKYPNNQLPDIFCQTDLDVIVDALNSQNIIPLITIDEFSNIRQMLKEGLVDASFLSDLRELALKGKACFVYAGTYDIKELPKEKEFGIEGQMTNTLPMHINEIEQAYADELIDACDLIIFDDKAKAYIRALSGCVPYWIQWICLDCGKYAVAHKKRHLGYGDVEHVIRVLTGEEQPSKLDTWEAIDETNFHNNQISPNVIAEHQLISCISFLIRESTHIERGVSMDELSRLWDKYNVSPGKRLNMTKALQALVEKKVVRQFTDETREVYRLNVDLFRRWWYVHHRDLSLILNLE